VLVYSASVETWSAVRQEKASCTFSKDPMAIDWDDVLGYSTNRLVKIRDRRLGIMVGVDAAWAKAAA